MITQVTILFSTYNGASKLPYMLTALTKQTYPKEYWKVIAVNNNSTDKSEEILLSYKDKLNISIYNEIKQGKGAALDLGFEYIEGDLVIITDDDVIPEPDWIEQFVKVANEKKDFDMFSGLILPEWQEKPEQWIIDWVPKGPVYALNSDVEEGPLDPRMIFGPNSAFRTSILPNKYQIMDAHVGPQADLKQYAMGGDTAFALYLGKKGCKAWHTSLAIVRHIIPRHYIKEDWILSRAERYGMGVPYFSSSWFVNQKYFNNFPIGPSLKFLFTTCFVIFVKKLPRSKFRWNFLWSYYYRRGIIRKLHDIKSVGLSVDEVSVS